MLRPKVLERLRHQIGLLNRPEDAAVVDALICQPRASEIIMDRSVGRGRPISATNVEETIAAIKETAADALRRQYESNIDAARTQAAQEAEEKSRDRIEQLLREKEELQGQLADQKSESSLTVSRIDELEEQLAIAIQRQAELEETNGRFHNGSAPTFDHQDDQSDEEQQVVLNPVAVTDDLYRLRDIAREAGTLLYPIANGRGGRQAILDVEKRLTQSEAEASAIYARWREALKHSEVPLSPNAKAVLDEILDRRRGPSAILDVIRNFSQADMRRPQVKSKELLAEIGNFDLVVTEAGAEMDSPDKNVSKGGEWSKNIFAVPLSILSKAIEAVPAVRYALGVVGIAAAVAIVVTLANGYSHITILSIALMVVGMFVLFLFSLLVSSKSPSVHFAGLVLTWGVTLFVLIFMVFTATAAAIGWPCNWAMFLNFHSTCESTAHI